MTCKILIVDDHVAIRLGIKQLLEDVSDEVVFGEAVDGEEALAQVKSTSWDLIILDLRMPNIDGLVVLTILKQWQPNLPVLIYSVYPEDQFARHALKFGADGYVCKDAHPHKLLMTVRAVLSGKAEPDAPAGKNQLPPADNGSSPNGGMS